ARPRPGSFGKVRAASDEQLSVADAGIRAGKPYRVWHLRKVLPFDFRMVGAITPLAYRHCHDHHPTVRMSDHLFHAFSFNGLIAVSASKKPIASSRFRSCSLSFGANGTSGKRS